MVLVVSFMFFVCGRFFFYHTDFVACVVKSQMGLILIFI